jgi:hypothetical protein
MNISNKAKNQRRLEAEKRQEIYNSLSNQQRIALAKSRRGNSEKELKKLGA